MSYVSEKDLEAKLRDLNAAGKHPDTVRECKKYLLDLQAADVRAFFTNAATWYQYAIALMRTGEFRRASDVYYGKLRSSEGYDDEMRADWIREIGIDMLRRGETTGARNAFEDALAIHRTCDSPHRLTDGIMISLTFLVIGTPHLAPPRLERILLELLEIKLTPSTEVFEDHYGSIERLANWWFVLACAVNGNIDDAKKIAEIVAANDASVERRQAARALMAPGSNSIKLAERLVRKELKRY